MPSPSGPTAISTSPTTSAPTATSPHYYGTTGAFIDDFVPPDRGGLRSPFALVFGPSGRGPRELDLYVVSRGTDSVKRYHESTGLYLGDFVAGGVGGLDNPFGLTFGPDGSLYVTTGAFDGTNSSAVFRFRGPSGPPAPLPSAENSGAVFVAGGAAAPHHLRPDLRADGSGDGRQDLYLPSSKTAGSNKADHQFSTIKRYDGVTGGFLDTFVAANSGGLDQPNHPIFTETDPTTLRFHGATRASPGRRPQAPTHASNAIASGSGARFPGTLSRPADPGIVGKGTDRPGRGASPPCRHRLTRRSTSPWPSSGAGHVAGRSRESWPAVGSVECPRGCGASMGTDRRGVTDARRVAVTTRWRIRAVLARPRADGPSSGPFRGRDPGRPGLPAGRAISTSRPWRSCRPPERAQFGVAGLGSARLLFRSSRHPGRPLASGCAVIGLGIARR